MKNLTKIILLVSAAALGLYDIVALVKGGGEATISVVILEASHNYPIIPFLFGVLMGHFFWRIQTPIIGSKKKPK